MPKQAQAIREQPQLSKPVCACTQGDQACVLLAGHEGVKHISSKGRQW